MNNNHNFSLFAFETFEAFSGGKQCDTAPGDTSGAMKKNNPQASEYRYNLCSSTKSGC